MAARSKWQGLPTEAINPATLAIDKLSPADIVEGMLIEDRKMLAAVQREKSRIVVGVDIITQALRKSGRIRRPSARPPAWCRPSWRAGRMR
jgi:N-acetylmuramic acid 6-phosphate (MurNAc-6-P) etherase